jgi:sialate O-acetylesterase
VPVNGRWVAELPALNSGGPYELEVRADGETLLVKDVYVGRVYLAAGQSNAELQLSSSSEPVSDYRDDPMLRNFFVRRPWLDDDPFAPAPGWTDAKKDSVGKWSAIAYLAGRETRELTGKAVGMITCAVGASVIESWLPEDVARNFALKRDRLHPDHFEGEYSAWNKNGVIFEKMLSTLFPFSLNGVIWYQGESDTSSFEGEVYDAELLCFMRAVRDGVRNPNLHFAVIQIADLDWRQDDGWRSIQSAQRRAAEKDAGSSLIVSNDVCESDRIHPTRKTELSVRAARVLEDKAQDDPMPSK